ncbi:hypothetical protein UlMin_036509 [Ulmus minor]
MSNLGQATLILVPTVDNPDQLELIHTLEALIGSSFSSKPLWQNPNPLIIMISRPCGIGKDVMIKELRETREGLHFVVTVTSREIRLGEIHGKDYFFVSKEQFLEMVKNNELLEHALVYGDYKGIPKQQIRDFMAKGYDIVLRVDIQGAETLRKIFGRTAVFLFVMVESEIKLVERLIGRKTERKEELLVRDATVREEVKQVKIFDYVIVNAEGNLDNVVKLIESIIDADKAMIWQKTTVI